VHNKFVLLQAGTYIKEFVHGDLGRTHPRYEIRYFQFMGIYLEHVTMLSSALFTVVLQHWINFGLQSWNFATWCHRH